MYLCQSKNSTIRIYISKRNIWRYSEISETNFSNLSMIVSRYLSEIKINCPYYERNIYKILIKMQDKFFLRYTYLYSVCIYVEILMILFLLYLDAYLTEKSKRLGKCDI